MKKYLSIYANWRNDVLLAIFGISLFLFFGETDSLLVIVLTKLISILGFSIFGSLFKYWKEQGKINELSSLANED